MIEVFHYPNAPGPYLNQRKEHPGVFLDTCALRAISADPVLRDRFVAAIHSKGGTLIINKLSFSELANQDQRHATLVAALIERVYPRLYMQQWSPEKVIAAERAWFPGTSAGSPDADWNTLYAMMSLTPEFGGSFTFAFAYRHVKEFNEKVNLKDQCDALKKHYLKFMNDSWTEVSKTNKQTKFFASKPGRQELPAPTYPMLSALICLYSSNKNQKEDPNNGVDLLQATVPSAYSDFVVLDRGWCDRVNRAAKMVVDAGFTAPIAKAYSVRKHSLPKFFEALEAYVAEDASR
jgi:hypothetical protein